MKIAGYYRKTLFGMFALMGLIVISTSALYIYTVDRQLTNDLLTNSKAIALSIADSNVHMIVSKNYSALQSIIDQFVEIKGVSYVFVVDETGGIIAHTFVPGVPKEIGLNYRDGRPSYDRELKGMGSFKEVTANILVGEAGRVHVGVDKGYTALQVQTAIGKIVYLLTILFVFSVLISYVLIYRVSQPLVDLGNYVRHAGGDGDRGKPLNAKHAQNLLERNDEIGEAARGFRAVTKRRP
ncbi:MAG: hypothetical protein JRJ60_11155 [Deltaproteobacteria bacterium]|nr:hypothetical protein [Deltaproteobacteria bacterium]